MNGKMPGLLARRMEEEGMPAGIPISVAELHRRLLPYPLCRDRLGYASKGEYDVELLKLIVDTDTVDVPETALREAVHMELSSPEPGLALLQRFAASEIRMNLSRVETGPPIAELEPRRERGDFIPGLDDPLLVPRDEAADALGIVDEDTGLEAAGADSAPATEGAGAMVEADSTPSTPCRSCGGDLPQREGVRFCPACGADQWCWPCPACGEEVERGWSYCAMCGKLLPTT
jgi:predicted RNA-binding Zn-ribbon protein involved in translation (DUF1610 family)